MVMALVLFLIIFLVLFNVFLLRQKILEKVEETLGEQASDNMEALVKEGGAFMYSILTEVSIMAGFIREMLINMHRDEQQFALDYLEPFLYESLPESCLQLNDFYGKSPICSNYSSYYALDTMYDPDLLRKISRFDNI